MATASSQDLKTLDGARTRLKNLSNALNSLNMQLQHTHPLPSWQSLQDASVNVNNQLQLVSQFLSAAPHAAVLAAAHAFPLPSFPDNAHRPVVEQLLRKKPEPATEDRLAAGLAAGRAAGMPAAELRDLWATAVETAVDASHEVPWGIDYTVAEQEAGVEGVVTGLKRDLDDGTRDASDEDEEEGGMDVDDAGPGAGAGGPAAPASQAAVAGPSLEDLLRFMNNGSVAPGLAAGGMR